MFDYVSLHIPIDGVRYPAEGWQTKDMWKNLDAYIIKDDGLYVIRRIVDGASIMRGDEEKVVFSGVMSFYQDVDDIWHEFAAVYRAGNIAAVVRVYP